VWLKVVDFTALLPKRIVLKESELEEYQDVSPA
jgi:hypothetical protein